MRIRGIRWAWRALIGAWLAAAGIGVTAGCGHDGEQTVVLATTTSVADSGLLDVLTVRFREARGIVLRAHLVGSGRALRLLERGDANVVVSHAPDAEAAALERHPEWRYRKIMFNDFVIVGPPSDPAGVKGAATAEVAMQRVAASTARFLSRGDGSGTHERENQLWVHAGAWPSDDRLVVAGAGMGTTLRIASETSTYTLTDRTTYLQHEGTLRLEIVFEGGPLMVNTYGVMLDPRGGRAAAAQAFFDWLTAGAGREVIRGYTIRGRPGFRVWPEGVAADDPRALPFTRK